MWLPRVPSGWALPLSVIAFLAIAIAGWQRQSVEANWRRPVRSALMPLALIAGCILLGFVLAFIAQTLSGTPDPTYAYPLAMRIALGFGAWGMTLLVTQVTDARGAAISAWLWMAALAVITAAIVPGLSAYFLFPSLIAATFLLAAAFMRCELDSAFGQAALLVSALAALFIWFPLVVSGETLMGLRLHPLFTVPAAFGLMTLVPLIALRPIGRREWSASAAIGFVVALGAAIVAGLLPAYSVESPQRLNIIYYENGNMPARWIADTSWKAKSPEPIPPSLKKGGNFKFDSDAYAGLNIGAGDIAPAGAPRYPSPTATIISDSKSGAVRHVTLRLRGSADTDAMAVFLPKEVKLLAVDARGQHVVPAAATRILCLSRDCRDLTVALTLRSTGAMTLNFAERRYGLPAFGATLAARRPNIAMPSQSGDGVLLANSLRPPR